MSLFFKNREGQTPLEEEMRSDLKLKHIQDMSELYEIESENIAQAISWCRSTTKKHLEYPTWIELHKQMLGKIWKFAGTIRTTELQNTDFKMPYDVRPSLLVLEKDLKFWIEQRTYLPKEMIAIFHERLLTIHPFKDGNGRWSRILTEFICAREKIDSPTWGVLCKDEETRRKVYIESVMNARHELDHSELMKFMWE